MNTTTPTPYNPDHARRGGVFIIEAANGIKFFFTIVNNTPVRILTDKLDPFELGEHETPESSLKEIEEAGCKVYMASEADCIEAGIVYIENQSWQPIESFPPPKYVWIGDPDEKPNELSSDDWEEYEIDNNRAIICDTRGLVTEAFEWFGTWYLMLNEAGDFYSDEVTPIYYMPIPQAPKSKLLGSQYANE